MSPEVLMTLFTTVKYVLEIPGRGIVLVLANWGADVKVKLGEKIQLRTPKGIVIESKIHGIELIKTTSGGLTGIVLPREVGRSEISAETEIWLSER